MLRAVIFDLDGTLYRSPQYVEAFYDSLLELMGEKLGIGKERAFKVFGEIRREDISIALAAEKLGEDASVLYNELARRLRPDKYIRRDPELKKTLSKLRSCGLRLALLTNAGRSVALNVLEALGLSTMRFDVIVTRDDITPKPSQQAFTAVVDRLQIQPAEAVYVDDLLKMLRQAKQLGMTTVLISDTEVRSDYVDAVIRSPLQLPALLRKSLNRYPQAPTGRDQPR